MNQENNNNDDNDNYLNDLSDTLNPYDLDNSHRKFCTRCGHQCFPISFHTPDLYKCSECGFSYSLVEKHNLPEMEKVAPITRNKTFNFSAFDNMAYSFDSYD